MILIPRKYKALVRSCLDCHKTFESAALYPCVIYKVCPLHVSDANGRGNNGKGKKIRACLVIGSDCDCK